MATFKTVLTHKNGKEVTIETNYEVTPEMKAKLEATLDEFDAKQEAEENQHFNKANRG
jgi:hypothetical protein